MEKKHKIISGVIGAIVLALTAHWLLGLGVESTDDAVIEAHVTPISANVAGYISQVNIHDNQAVKKGDVLLVIDERDYQSHLAVAKADFLAAKAVAENAVIDAKRQRAIGSRAGAQRDIDNAIANEAASKAAYDKATAQLALAEKQLSDCRVTAPEDGVVTVRTAEVGGYAQPGRQLLTLVGKDRWVIANFKENQIADMRSGQKAEIEVDAYPHLKLSGHVDSIQAGTGGRFSLFPPENATGNFVKVVQRVPVKIVLDQQIPEGIVVGPGLSVVPTVHVTGKAESGKQE